MSVFQEKTYGIFQQCQVHADTAFLFSFRGFYTKGFTFAAWECWRCLYKAWQTLPGNFTGDIRAMESGFQDAPPMNTDC
jgi:hypothetical protein